MYCMYYSNVHVCVPYSMWWWPYLRHDLSQKGPFLSRFLLFFLLPTRSKVKTAFREEGGAAFSGCVTYIALLYVWYSMKEKNPPTKFDDDKSFLSLFFDKGATWGGDKVSDWGKNQHTRRGKKRRKSPFFHSHAEKKKHPLPDKWIHSRITCQQHKLAKILHYLLYFYQCLVKKSKQISY